MSLLSCLDFLGGCILESDSSSNFLLVEDSEFLLTLEALSGLLLVLDSESAESGKLVQPSRSRLFNSSFNSSCRSEYSCIISVAPSSSGPTISRGLSTISPVSSIYLRK